MPFGPTDRLIGSIETALMATGTTEGAFRTAVVDVARQVDENEIDTNAARTLAVTGSVATDPLNPVDFNIGDGNRAIVINTIQQTNSIGTDAIIDDAITTAKIDAGAVDTLEIADNAITNAKIASGQIVSAQLNNNAKQRFRILPAGGGIPLFQIDGFSVL